MPTTLEKRVQISVPYAQRLEQLAVSQGVTENTLMEQALDLLFQERLDTPCVPPELQADLELLQQWEAKQPETTAPRPVFPIHPADIVSFVGTPIDPTHLHRLGEKS